MKPVRALSLALLLAAPGTLYAAAVLPPSKLDFSKPWKKSRCRFPMLGKAKACWVSSKRENNDET